MKNLKTISIASTFALLFFILQGCNFSTANLSSLTTSKDKAGKESSSSFKSGDTLFGQAVVSNNPGKVKVKLYLVAEDAKGLTKGETLKGSEVSVDLDGDGTASYSVPVTEGFPAGNYQLNADMINDAGEKKDSKTAKVTITAAPKPEAPPADAPKTDDAPADDADSK